MDDVQTFEVSWEECLRLRPLLKSQDGPIEFEGKSGRWILKKIEIQMTPQTGIVSTVHAVPAL